MGAVHIVLIVDKSGSMAPLAKDTIGGFNAYLDGIEGEAKVSAMVFDTGFTVLFKDKRPAEAPRLDRKSYIANGGTALYDAVGKTIEELDFPAGDKVLCVITTDGEENSSREYNAEQIKAAVAAAQERGWDFIYLGADAHAWTGAGAIGITPQYTFNTVSVTGAHQHTRWAGIASATNTYSHAVMHDEDQPLIAAVTSYATATAPITTTYTEAVNQKVWNADH